MPGFYENLCGCFDDCGSCCIGCFCPCIIQAFAVSKSNPGHSWVIPLIINVCISPCNIGFCINRSTIRGNLGMESSPVEDFCLSLYCCFCTSCQEYRESTKRFTEHANNRAMKAGLGGSY